MIQGKYKIILMFMLLVCFEAFAKDRDFHRITPTLTLTTSYSLSATYKSELVASNDTGTGFSYSLGGYAGKDGNFGFFLKVDSASTTFELNNSSNTVSWQDTVFRYRWSYFYLGPVFSTMTYQVTNQGTETINAVASGTGGNLGVLIPLGRGGSFFIDLYSVTMSNTVNSLTTETSIGARTDYDLGATVDVTSELVDLVFGYKQQQYAVTTDTSYAEVCLATYIGFKFSLFF